jgi:hypothetical protein
MVDGVGVSPEQAVRVATMIIPVANMSERIPFS